MNKFKGTAEITDEGVKKHFKNFEPANAIFEYVWNGFDANAQSVDIKTIFNNMDGLETVEVFDNGDGIDLNSLKNSFEKFNESTKKNNDDKHGSHGKGRLSFHRMCTSASWYTKKADYNARIDVNTRAIRDYEGDYLSDDEQHKSLIKIGSGTCVVLTDFTVNKFPNDDVLMNVLSKEFGWFLALNADRKVTLNGKEIYIPEHDLHEKNVAISGIDFTIKVIRWNDKPSSEKSYNYLVTSLNRVIEKGLSRSNNKVTFYTSAFAFSDWLDNYDSEALEIDPTYYESKKIVKKLFQEMTDYQRVIYKDYLRSFVNDEIDRFDKEGYFPTYKGLDSNYAGWRKENTKKFVKDMYLSDPQIFNKVNPKTTKILIRLLDKILVSNENDTLFDVLEGVLDLSSENVNRLANQLKSTTLENIVSTIESLQRRHQTIHQLRDIMDNRFSEILETPDLQKIIENNTWLFGPQYATLGAEEDTFTVISKKLRDEVKEIDKISESDIEEGLNVEGVNRQVDLFLARKVPAFNGDGRQIFKCIIIEIKRPSISLNKKHLSQIDDYCEIISKHPAFGSSKMVFEIILIGRKISKDDFQIKQRMNGLKDKAEFGLVSHDDKMKCYVKDWYTIFDEFELSNDYLLETLNTKLDSLSAKNTSDMVKELQGFDAKDRIIKH
ncbi:ATP-binding protein [Marinomonas sp. BSi20584]|uniref:ATP-binding protein n=1 Tax=Marinomonas sp. BSi20584 TaxID=1594462 RepID=UPI000C1EE44C|nr:ATP-binding protein [Marinomonas sp. BSi20584]PJE54125.1 DNA mismatch repair protein [Marinomonas sp. BSi20584]